MKTEVLAELRKQGLSVWASAGAGIAPDLWVPGENAVLFSATKAATNVFRDSVNIWSVRLSPKNWKALAPARQLTSGTAYDGHPAMTQSGDLLFASAEMKTGVWMLPLTCERWQGYGGDEATDPRHCIPRPAQRGTRRQQSGLLRDQVGKHGYLDHGSGYGQRMAAHLHSHWRERSSDLRATAPRSFTPFTANARRTWSHLEEEKPTKICDDCGTWNVSHDATNLLYWYSTAKPVVSLGLFHLPTGQKVELIKHPSYSLYQPQFSPDDRFIAFLAQTGQGRSRIYVTRFRGMERLDASEWIPITAGDLSDDKPRWSPDGNLMYFTSNRDGFMCIWAQRLAARHEAPCRSGVRCTPLPYIAEVACKCWAGSAGDFGSAQRTRVQSRGSYRECLARFARIAFLFVSSRQQPPRSVFEYSFCLLVRQTGFLNLEQR